VAPEAIVIKIFYALLQAASERLPQQQEPPLVGFGISSRVRLDTPSLLPSSRLHLGLDCVFAVGNFFVFYATLSYSKFYQVSIFKIFNGTNMSEKIFYIISPNYRPTSYRYVF
jgi:hypothetical protein